MPKQAIVLETDDIKKLIAKEYNCDLKDIIKNQYTYTIIIKEK